MGEGPAGAGGERGKIQDGRGPADHRQADQGRLFLLDDVYNSNHHHPFQNGLRRPQRVLRHNETGRWNIVMNLVKIYSYHMLSKSKKKKKKKKRETKTTPGPGVQCSKFYLDIVI